MMKGYGDGVDEAAMIGRPVVPGEAGSQVLPHRNLHVVSSATRATGPGRVT